MNPTLPQAHLEFCRLFNTKDKLPIDGVMSVLTHSVKIDIFQFDDWLLEKHIPLDAESTCDMVERLYGEEARTFIESLL